MPDTMLATPAPKSVAETETPAFAHDEVGLLAPLYPLPRIELVEGQGARVRDAGGKEYVDFTSGIAVNAFGHAPRGLAETVAAQMARLGHCSNLYANTPALSLARAARRSGFPAAASWHSRAASTAAPASRSRPRSTRRTASRSSRSSPACGSRPTTT